MFSMKIKNITNMNDKDFITAEEAREHIRVNRGAIVEKQWKAVKVAITLAVDKGEESVTLNFRVCSEIEDRLIGLGYTIAREPYNINQTIRW